MSSYRDWPHDISELQQLAREEIIPRWREDTETGHQDYPTIPWLANNGYAHLRWIVETKHDMSIKAFFTMIVGLKVEDSRWPIDDAVSIKRLNKYLSWCDRYRDWAANTEKTQYYLLRRIVEEFTKVIEREDLVVLARDQTEHTKTYDGFTEAIHRIKQEAESDDSAYQYLRSIQRWMEWLERRSLIEENPIEKIEKEFNWNLSTDGSEPLTPDQIGRLWREAETLIEYLVIIGYVIWGVRRKELPAIHRSQLTMDDGKLYIEFEEDDRKTGAATVEVLIGAQVVEQQLDRGKSYSRWEGNLLFDPDEPSEPLSEEKAASIFTKLCERADVLIEDSPATPNNGRATWHTLQARAGAILRELAGEYGEEQAYEAVESAIGYQGVTTKEEMRQMIYLQRLKEVLPADVVTDDFVFAEDLQGSHRLQDFR